MSANQISKLLQSATEQLSPISDSPSIDAEVLLLASINSQQTEKEVNRAFLRSWPDHVLPLEQLTKFEHYLKLRLTGIPIAYILGKKEFWSLEFIVNKYTLIPRPDTETLVESALELIPKEAKWNILDLGTGSGAIALSLANERANSQIFASDKSSDALHIAQLNKKQLTKGNTHLVCCNWLDGLKPSSFQMIVSNPPYIRKNDPHLAELKSEPLSALISDEDGLKDCRLIIQQAKSYLIKPGYLLLEHGYDQAHEIKILLTQNNYTGIKQIKDLSGIIRLSIANIS